jgi:hypothetical protein
LRIIVASASAGLLLIESLPLFADMNLSLAEHFRAASDKQPRGEGNPASRSSQNPRADGVKAGLAFYRVPL